jgi:hypothetical protein
MKIKPLLIIAGIAAIMLFLAIRGCQKNKQDLQATNEYLSLTESKFKEFKTVSGLNAAKANEQILSLEALLLIKKREIARLTKELGLKPKRIKEIVEIVIEGKDSIVLKRDSFYYESSPDIPNQPIPFVYEDKWNSFQAYQSGEQIELLYAITDSISLVTTKEKGGFKVQALSSNPAIRITGLSQIKVEDKKPKRWWIVPVSVAAGVFLGAKVF